MLQISLLWKLQEINLQGGKDGELLAELSGEDVVRRGMATHSPAGRD